MNGYRRGFKLPMWQLSRGQVLKLEQISKTHLPRIFSPQKGKVPETDDLLLSSLLFIHLGRVVQSWVKITQG